MQVTKQHQNNGWHMIRFIAFDTLHSGEKRGGEREREREREAGKEREGGGGGRRFASL